MGGTRHYIVRRRDHPGSSEKEIAEEPDWRSGHNHHVGFKNRDNRLPGYAHSTETDNEAVEAAQNVKYEDLRLRKPSDELVNFRDIVNMKEDVHLSQPGNLSVGWRFMLECTENWVKYEQDWPANKKREENKDSGSKDDQKDPREDKTQQHGHLDTPEDQLTLEQKAFLRALQHEKDSIVDFKVNPGNLVSPQKDHKTELYIDEADQFTPDNWIPRSANLIRLTGKHPLNAEAHLSNFFEAGLVTPNGLHYVRNHGSVPRLLWDFHKLEVDVGDEREMFTMEGLKRNFKSINIPVFLACDGNRRKELNLIRKSKGFNWGPAGGGCAYWKGALLRDVLLEAGLDLKHLKKDEETKRKWINFQGAETLAEGPYETCIPLDYAMDEGNDVLLAYEMNDVPLPPDHGYPLRLMIPGFVGGRCVKWLKRIWISEEENNSYYHIWDNRVLPSFVTDTESPFAELLFRHPDTACNEQNLNSIIVRPRQGERLYLDDIGRSGRSQSGRSSPAEYRIQGFAYDGGGHEVQKVEVTLDDGVNWLYCIRKYPEMPIRHGKKFWTWCHWHVDVPLSKLVQARHIMVRCFNVFKNCQPRDPNWNLMGMMNNCWYKVQAEIVTPGDESDADSGLGSDSGSGDEMPNRHGAYALFRHPTEPGTGDGGWMKPSIENQMEQAKREAGTPQKQFTREEIEKHDKEDDCWIVVDGKVYDATSVMSWHPGGKAPIMAHAGRVHQEATEEFASIHDDFAYTKLKECLLGTVTEKAANFIKKNAKRQAAEQAGSKRHSKVTLQKHRWFPAKLLAREAVSKDTRLYRFQLPDHRAILGLSTCKHIQLGFHMLDKMVVRSYTPTNPILPPKENTPEVLSQGDDVKSKDGNVSAHDKNPRDGDGTFELMVKTYFPTSENPGGAMSNILDCMPLGEDLEIRGPTGDIEYQGNGKFLIDGEERKFHRISLVLGGSGITPGYSLMARTVISGEKDVEVRVIDGNKSEGDILLRSEMEHLQERSDGRMAITHVLSHPSDEWQGLKGHVNADIIKEHLFPPGEDTGVFVCGPPPMIQKSVMPALKDWGYEEDKNVFGF